jgi:hypothetical protein
MKSILISLLEGIVFTLFIAACYLLMLVAY